MNYSKQRELIRQTVCDSQDHLTAGEIYAEVRKVMPNISLGTVYRNLNTMVEAGMLSMLFYDSKEFFEAPKERHSHVVCLECGAIYDVDLPLFGWLDDMIRQQCGFEVTHRELLAHGICRECQAKRK